MSDAQPLVTVIIASYNHARYIEESILSVLNQTYKNIELLVVDDGSSDDSVERIKVLQEKYGFDFRVQQNQGLTNTLNAAIARSKGSLIVPFGSDDIMLPERIATQVAYMDGKPEVGICAGNIELIDADGNLFPEKRQRRDVPFRRLDFDDMFLERKPYPPAPTLMIRREALDKVGGFDPNIRLEDLLIELKVTRAGYFIDGLNVLMARYRKHPTNSYKNHRFMVDNILRSSAIIRCTKRCATSSSVQCFSKPPTAIASWPESCWHRSRSKPGTRRPGVVSGGCTSRLWIKTKVLTHFS
jgi:alpha-1,3-rhamnosyltransferase